MTKIQILTAPGCAHCEAAKRKIESIIEKFAKEKDIKIEEINIVEHPEIAVRYQLMSTPGIVIDGKLEFVGVPNEEAFRKKLAST